MPGQKSKRRSRKRRASAGPPRAVTSERRQQRAQRVAESRAQTAQQERRAKRNLGTEGERPPSPFGGVPVSEIAIFAGGIGATVGLIEGGGIPLIVGLIVCALGVVEVTAREHFSGFRSHSSLLAGIPAVAIATLVFTLLGKPRERALVLLVVVPVYAVLFWLLRQRFRRARHVRVTRPPAP